MRHLLILTQAVDRNHPVLGFFYEWIASFAEQLDTVTVIALSAHAVDLPHNVKVISLGKEKGAGRAALLWGFIREISKNIRQCDAVFVHMCPIYAIIAAPFARYFHKPLSLWYVHASVTGELRCAEKLVDRIFTASAASFALQSTKVIITGHGINTDNFKPATTLRADHLFRIISIGRISPIKKYETLIEASALLVNRHDMKNLQVRIFGDVGHPSQLPYLSSLKSLVKKHSLENHVIFLGPLSHHNVADHYQGSDIAVNCSDTDSLDKSVLEAMACGRLTLTSNRAFHDIFYKNFPYLIFKKGDAGDLAKKIILVVGMDVVMRGAMENDLRQIVVRDHDLKRLIGKLVYEQSILYS